MGEDTHEATALTQGTISSNDPFEKYVIGSCGVATWKIPWEELGALPSKEQELAPEADSNFCTGKPHPLWISTGCREMGLEQKTEAVYQEKFCCCTDVFST